MVFREVGQISEGMDELSTDPDDNKTAGIRSPTTNMGTTNHTKHSQHVSNGLGDIAHIDNSNEVRSVDGNNNGTRQAVNIYE